MSTEVAVSFESVAKNFRYFASPLQRLREIVWPFGRIHHIPVPVLRDLTFTIPRGETVAIIGANGVGKSTLLYLVAGLLQASSGKVTVNGRVTGLLDLGGSFLPDLTGRENVRFYHQIISRSAAQSAERESAIEDFAGIGEFFDRPVRTYSSGMFLRLAFAAATFEVPDILLVDEVLAVGDSVFQQKCYRRLREMRDAGTTTLIVTHVVQGLAGVCDRVMVLEQGGLVFNGDPARGIDRYYQLFFMAPQEPKSTGSELRYGAGGATICHAFTSRDAIHESRAFASGDRVRVVVEIEFQRDVEAPAIGFSCATKEGLRIYATTSAMLGEVPVPALAGDRRVMEIEFIANVGVGDLFLDLSVFELHHGSVVILEARTSLLHVTVAVAGSYGGVADLSAAMRIVR